MVTGCRRRLREVESGWVDEFGVLQTVFDKNFWQPDFTSSHTKEPISCGDQNSCKEKDVLLCRTCLIKIGFLW